MCSRRASTTSIRFSFFPPFRLEGVCYHVVMDAFFVCLSKYVEFVLFFICLEPGKGSEKRECFKSTRSLICQLKIIKWPCPCKNSPARRTTRKTSGQVRASTRPSAGQAKTTVASHFFNGVRLENGTAEGHVSQFTYEMSRNRPRTHKRGFKI